jgi:hypothetical protein
MSHQHLTSSKFCRHPWSGPSSNCDVAWQDIRHSQLHEELPECKRGMVTSKPSASDQPIQIPARRFLLGTLPVTADGPTYLLTIIDRTTRWLEAVPLPSMEATSCAEAIISMWISRYGMPSNITTDRGRYISPIDCPLPEVRVDTYHHQSLSPRVQWHG